MSLLAKLTEQKVYVHGAVYTLAKLYQEMGIPLIDFAPVSESAKGADFKKELIIAPPHALGSPWMKRFPSCKTALASGWMEVRGTRRRKALDMGFVLSDHADFSDLIKTIVETKAQTVLTTHGSAHTLAKYLQEEKGLEAYELKGLEAVFEED